MSKFSQFVLVSWRKRLDNNDKLKSMKFKVSLLKSDYVTFKISLKIGQARIKINLIIKQLQSNLFCLTNSSAIEIIMSFIPSSQPILKSVSLNGIASSLTNNPHVYPFPPMNKMNIQIEDQQFFRKVNINQNDSITFSSIISVEENNDGLLVFPNECIKVSNQMIKSGENTIDRTIIIESQIRKIIFKDIYTLFPSQIQIKAEEEIHQIEKIPASFNNQFMIPQEKYQKQQVLSNQLIQNQEQIIQLQQTEIQQAQDELKEKNMTLLFLKDQVQYLETQKKQLEESQQLLMNQFESKLAQSQNEYNQTISQMKEKFKTRIDKSKSEKERQQQLFQKQIGELLMCTQQDEQLVENNEVITKYQEKIKQQDIQIEEITKQLQLFSDLNSSLHYQLSFVQEQVKPSSTAVSSASPPSKIFNTLTRVSYEIQSKEILISCSDEEVEVEEEEEKPLVHKSSDFSQSCIQTQTSSRPLRLRRSLYNKENKKESQLQEEKNEGEMKVKKIKKKLKMPHGKNQNDTKKKRNNIVKNFAKGFRIFMNKLSVEDILNQKIPLQITDRELERLRKHLSIVTEYNTINEGFMTYILSQPLLSILFKYFLEFKAEQWINNSQVTNKEENLQILKQYLVEINEQQQQQQEQGIEGNQNKEIASFFKSNFELGINILY